MKQQKFEIAETNILKDIKNQKIEKIYYTEPIYGRIKVTLNDYALLISNVMHEANLIGNDEDITYFTIDKVDKNYDFRYFGDDDSVKDIEVNEKVLSVSVVNDLIKYNN